MPFGGAWKRRAAGRIAAAVSILALLCGFSSAAAADGAAWQGTVEFSLGRYNIADPLFNTIYRPGGSITGLGLTANLIPRLGFSLDVKVLSKNGSLSHSKEKTSFVLIPVSLGLRASYPVSFLIPFAGLGLDYYFYFENNPIGTVVDHAKGWHAAAGVYFQFGETIPILPFAKIKYTMVKASAGSRTIDLGGWEYGAGLAIAF
ncbi:MAG: hypothetical protein PHE62_12460 [Acidobacteriota bacterium]|jgi:hypothetical protein|nr:hypothetical protein [Acidobacteriota bacterium]